MSAAISGWVNDCVVFSAAKRAKTGKADKAGKASVAAPVADFVPFDYSRARVKDEGVWCGVCGVYCSVFNSDGLAVQPRRQTRRRLAGTIARARRRARTSTLTLPCKRRISRRTRALMSHPSLARRAWCTRTRKSMLNLRVVMTLVVMLRGAYYK